MKTLIIGASSTIGKNLVPAISQFSEVITAGRSQGDILLDLNKPLVLNQLPDEVDVVIHLAAHMGGKTIDEMLLAEQVNVSGTLKACQVAVLTKAKHFI